MTIAYNLDVSSTSTHGFLKILFRWRGSIWKSVYCEFLIWTIVYYIIMFIYRVLLTKSQMRIFELVAADCDKKLDYIPLIFMLGFFVTIVVDRWKNIFFNIGFIDTVALVIGLTVRGSDEETIIHRRNMVRYLLLTQVLVYRDISVKVRKRFPTIQSIEDAGYFEPHERVLWEETKTKYSRYWIPVNWCFSLCQKLKKENKIESDAALRQLTDEIKNHRIKLGTLCDYDWVPVPLAYPQVVFTAVRVYFVICLWSRQYLITEGTSQTSLIDMYVPFMTMLQLIFYMGWLKVAEALLNPLGEDDDDFEVNYIIDRNTGTGFCIVDMSYNEIPYQKLDKFVCNKGPMYSEATAGDTIHPLVGSATRATIVVKDEDVKMVPHVNQDDEKNIPSEGEEQHRKSIRNKERATTSRLSPYKGLRQKFSLNKSQSVMGDKVNPFDVSYNTRIKVSRPTLNEAFEEEDDNISDEKLDVVVHSSNDKNETGKPSTKYESITPINTPSTIVSLTVPSSPTYSERNLFQASQTEDEKKNDDKTNIHF
uniref:Bestrophin homolog n=1 Tax=Parastrongyloides trichosuri TaxID=131310 RepID=A0A0N4ZDG4_PARTI